MSRRRRERGCPATCSGDDLHDELGRAIRAAAQVRIGAPVYPLAADELECLGLDADALVACRRRRGQTFYHRLEQLERATLIAEGEWDDDRLDWPVEVLIGRQLGRAILAMAFGPANRQRLEVYWDAIHEYGERRFWMHEFAKRVGETALGWVLAPRIR